MVPSKNISNEFHKMPENLINNGRITKRLQSNNLTQRRKELKRFDRLMNVSKQRYVSKELLDQYESLYGIPEKFNQSDIQNLESYSTPKKSRVGSIEQYS